MSLFKGIVPSALTLSFLGLVACGSVDNDPPKLESVFGTVSAMDTLVAVFDKSIEDFDDSLVTSNQPITVVKQKNLYCRCNGYARKHSAFCRRQRLRHAQVRKHPG